MVNNGRASGSKDRLLESWKEIAAFLKVSIRTAQAWEKQRGLPILRRGSEKGSRVLANASDLEQWQEQQEFRKTNRKKAESSASGSRKHFPIAAPLAMAAALLFVVAAYLTFDDPDITIFTSCHLEGTELVVTDLNGEVSWRHNLPGLKTQYPRHPRLPGVHARFYDVEDDENAELLFSFLPEDHGTHPARVICFNPDGTIRWEHFYSRTITLNDREYRHFNGSISGIARAKDRDFIVLSSGHAEWGITRIVLLRPATGELVSEYWHPGRVIEPVIFDFDHDGDDELLFGGINNEGGAPGHPVIFLLDVPFERIDQIEGEDIKSFLGDENRKESFYLMLPTPDVYHELGFGPQVAAIRVDEKGITAEISHPQGFTVFYTFDRSLKLLSMKPAEAAKSFHDQLSVDGLIDHRLTEEETSSWARVVRVRTAPAGTSAEVEALFTD